MSNFKLSQLQELRNITDTQAQSSYIMVVANDETGKLKNYRIKISELSKFAENSGFVQETLTPDEVAQMINLAIKQHETVVSEGETIVIPEKIVEVDSTLKEVTETVVDIKDTTDAVVEETLNIKTTVQNIESTSTEAITKASTAVTKVEAVEETIQTVVEEKLPQVEQTIQTVVVEKLPQVEQNIVNITQEIEILKTTQPTIDAVTDEHVDEIFNECFGK